VFKKNAARLRIERVCSGPAQLGASGEVPAKPTPPHQKTCQLWEDRRELMGKRLAVNDWPPADQVRFLSGKARAHGHHDTISSAPELTMRRFRVAKKPNAYCAFNIFARHINHSAEINE
jgi:hypothetical protein